MLRDNISGMKTVGKARLLFDASQRRFNKDPIAAVDPFFARGVKMDLDNGLGVSFSKRFDMPKFTVVIRHHPHSADIGQWVLLPDLLRDVGFDVVGKRIVIEFFKTGIIATKL